MKHELSCGKIVIEVIRPEVVHERPFANRLDRSGDLHIHSVHVPRKRAERDVGDGVRLDVHIRDAFAMRERLYADILDGLWNRQFLQLVAT